MPEEPKRGSLVPVMDTVDHGQVIPLTRDGRPVALVTPIDPDQAWFCTEQWQAKEREADTDIAAGRSKVYYSDEEFLAALEASVETGKL